MKTVRPMLSDHCPVCRVCDVGVLWPNAWTDQDETWHSGRPRPWRHCVRWAQPPIFDPYLLRPNGCMDQDVTWYGGRPRPRRLCVRLDYKIAPRMHRNSSILAQKSKKNLWGGAQPHSPPPSMAFDLRLRHLGCPPDLLTLPPPRFPHTFRRLCP